ncbi:hypothetical protein M6G65_21010 [Methylobacterium tardum]|uniref:hypothetical protein n=1 Tax=Methylobacterium tardum TaxID=374432 RepID=UPI002021B625|nr:hypothetical protein [Methylobacterium tardum]URD35017.1 hypothetical protein M6G65_21010 [Methylobacterium tardum]
MIAPSPTFTKLAVLVLGLAACAAGARAQEIVPPSASGRGAILIYGNYCGPGNRGPGYAPIDALDLACAHHDACSTDPASGILTSCACNRRLEVEAGHGGARSAGAGPDPPDGAVHRELRHGAALPVGSAAVSVR